MLDRICTELIRALDGIEQFQRRFYPPTLASLQADLFPLMTSLKQAVADLEKHEIIGGLEDVRDAVQGPAVLVVEALELITSPSGSTMQEAVLRVMRAFRKCCRAQEQLFNKRRSHPCIQGFFLEPRARARIKELDPETPPRADTGLHHSAARGDPYARGLCSVYVPESYDGSEAWPLVVALHGGFGHGRDFIWTWLREARSRRFILMAPSSQGTTWSLLNPEVDGPVLRSLIETITRQWNIDRARILLTGISDGATFALINSFTRQSPFAAFAVVSGALAPGDYRMARGKRICWIHGSLDWMFPVTVAVRAAHLLEEAGAQINLRVIDDLSHTYPRDENDRILTWFDPSLSLSA